MIASLERRWFLPRPGLRHVPAIVIFVLCTFDIFALTAAGAPASLEAQDREGIRATINLYFRGHATGDASHMRKAFLPTAHIEGIREGKFTSWTLDEYCAHFKGEPATDESTRVRTIDLIDSSGNSAMGKATLVHGDTVFTDYFVLLKIDGEWRIANKVYYGRKK
jgi:hypothetical protein